MRRLPIRRGAWSAMCALLLFVVCATAATPDVRAWLDRDTMQLGETVTLNVEAQDGSSAQPDFSALKQDFDLLGTQSSQQISIVNGKSASKTLWAVGLEPKHAGSITIAPIRIGAAQTAPIALNVLAQAANAAPKAGGDVFLEVTAEPLTPYVQQEVRYTAKLYYAFDLTDGNLSEPKADGIGVQRLGQDKSYVATLAGRRYHVVERHYALTPEHSGAIEVPALTFRGTALDVTDPTGFFSRGRNVAAHSDALHLEVKPKPAEWTDGAWLPAASLLLKDENELPTQVHVGEPVTRTIRLQAQGLGYEQLPELELQAPDGAEMYPDKADTRTRDDGEWRYGERVRKFAFVPNRPGNLIIPGLTIRWWDTVHDRAETTRLPPQTLNVLAAAGAASAPASPPGAGGAQTPNIAAPAAIAASKSAAPSPQRAASRRLKILAMLGFALWLLTLALWWRSRHRTQAVANATPRVAATDASAQRAAFLRACALGEFAGAERALVAWARAERADIRNLGELGARLADAAQREALADLQRTRYAGASSQGLATRLQQAFKRGLAWRAASMPRAAADALPALYPDRDAID
ncbi:MAG: BatD family protein [Lysobacterales bacterium]